MGQSKKEKLIEKILIENYDKYFHLALRYVRNEADALDIVQEGAYKAIWKCDTLKEVNFAETWVYRIMLNEIYGLCRKKNPDLQGEVEMEGAMDAVSVEALDLRNAMTKLTDEEQTILDLRYFKDMKLSEVAEILGMNLSTVKSRLYRTIEKLREDLA